MIKYIVVDDGCPTPIVFGETLNHDFVAASREVKSAGFVSLDFENRKATAYGRSTSLNLGPDPKMDDWLLTRLFFPS